VSHLSARAGIVGLMALVATGCTEPRRENVASIEVLPKSGRIWRVGDTLKFTAQTSNIAGDTTTARVEWVSRNPAFVSIASSGLAKSLKKGGSAYIVATAGDKSDSALVEVPLTPCGDVKAQQLAVGQVVNDIGASGFCAADTPGAEYVAIAHNTSLASSSLSTIEVIGQGLGELTFARPSLASRTTFVRPTGLVLAGPKRDWHGEAASREAERTMLSSRVAGAQSWYRNRSMSATRSSVALSRDTVGDLRQVNVSMSASCTATPVLRTARIAAVSSAAIILDDKANPSGGFTDAEYASFAAAFDTVVNPLDTLTFGAPTDLDGNKRVIVLFTRAVNELTPAGSLTYEGGRTMSRDLFPKSSDGVHSACLASNVGEIFYLLVPDPNAQVNGNPNFTHDFVKSQTLVTIAHEYQHMINISRRMYLLNLPASQWMDEVWLHEGLSHMAESLLFHKVSGLPTRSNIDLATIVGTEGAESAFNDDMLGNFFLYDSFVDNTDITSPYHQSDDLDTRGATWTFLRYAADRLGPSDGDLFRRLVNSGLIGLTNLETQLNLSSTALQAMIRDFDVSVYADDFVPAANIYTQPSWNMRTIYAGIDSPGFTWPLTVTALSDNQPVAAGILAGGFTVYRFTAQPGTDSFVRVTGTSGIAMPVAMTMSVIRTK
jgi:hypothetical protein